MLVRHVVHFVVALVGRLSAIPAAPLLLGNDTNSSMLAPSRTSPINTANDLLIGCPPPPAFPSDPARAHLPKTWTTPGKVTAQFLTQTFRPEPWCFAINDWTDKRNKPDLQFSGPFRRLLTWIWNLRISDPDEPILIDENDICGAFRLVKFNPEVVPMHGYRVGPYLGFATGQTFGDNVSAANFDVCATAPANADSQNHGVFFPNGDCMAPPYPHQVDDCMFADIRHYFPLTSAASIVALEDVFGSTHPCQHILSMDKLELEYTERSGSNHVKATLVEIATVVGMIDSAAEFFPWARVPVLVLQDLLRDCIRQEYRRAIRSRKLVTQLHDLQRQLSRSLSDRFEQLRCRKLAEFVWRSRWHVQISRACTSALNVVYDYLVAAHPWEQPIGHIVSRNPAFFATTDASEQAVGVAIPSLSLSCFLPVSLPTWKLLKQPRKGRAQLHINTLEFIGIMLGFIMTDAYISCSPRPHPPSPILSLECDNTAAVNWSRKLSTGSAAGRRFLQLFAEYQLLSPLGLVVQHIAGSDNTLADSISRPCALYSPPLAHVTKRCLLAHLRQASLLRNELESWTLFLPSLELLLLLRSMLYSDVN
ncbi:hypothetical protein IV203_019954 [Nitzschia inconspicua]|uniref:Uncharacterized protein n=1 Tax=Nitzschia inconspicua TaxID=303405 RepID=A0A9K3Q7U3_9STRA|nr:hypothetical protein IV203_019954 [Nitzschia inconspicua]